MTAVYTTTSAVKSIGLPSKPVVDMFRLPTTTPHILETPSAKPLLPTPESSQQDLATQISSLRDELRDKRISHAARYKQLKLQAAEIQKLKTGLEVAGRVHKELGLKLGQEQDKTKAVAKKFDVAVANHASAVDKLMRVMPELEELRLAKEQGEHYRAHEEREHGKQLKNLELEKDANIQALQKDLASRHSKIQRLEADLHRQREINAMFTVDYDRDTTFTRRLSVPLRVSLPTGEAIPTPEPTPPGKQRQYRLPLVDLEDNQGIQGKKRSYNACDESGSSGLLPAKVRKPDVTDTPVRSEHQASHMRGGYH
ncbi:hypothetical protein BDV93DRAFT_592084 [Ceratobasidium sp. AG-I]|nr:hypothetical protein BDV93DRAFT_592084 [Ceratobasidium sp. AG-I]